MNWKTEKSSIKLKLHRNVRTGISPAQVKKKVPTPQVLGTEFCPLQRWNGLSWSVRLVLSPKGLTLFSCPPTSSAAHLAAWWAISVLRQLTWERGKEGRTQLPINNWYFSWFWFLIYFTFFVLVVFLFLLGKKGRRTEKKTHQTE